MSHRRSNGTLHEYRGVLLYFQTLALINPAGTALTSWRIGAGGLDAKPLSGSRVAIGRRVGCGDFWIGVDRITRTEVIYNRLMKLTVHFYRLLTGPVGHKPLC